MNISYIKKKFMLSNFVNSALFNIKKKIKLSKFVNGTFN